MSILLGLTAVFCEVEMLIDRTRGLAGRWLQLWLQFLARRNCLRTSNVAEDRPFATPQDWSTLVEPAF